MSGHVNQLSKPLRGKDVIADVIAERQAQDAQWHEQNHPDGTGVSRFDASIAHHARLSCQQAFREGRGTWRVILEEEVAEAFCEHDPATLRAELIQVAAVAVAWIEAIDRRVKQ